MRGAFFPAAVGNGRRNQAPATVRFDVKPATRCVWPRSSASSVAGGQRDYVQGKSRSYAHRQNEIDRVTVIPHPKNKLTLSGISRLERKSGHLIARITVSHRRKKMTRFKLLRVVAIVSMSIVTQARAQGIGNREVAAPPWSVVCMTDHGSNAWGEHMPVSGACVAHSGQRNSLSPPRADAPYRDGGDKTHDDWPANMILG